MEVKKMAVVEKKEEKIQESKEEEKPTIRYRVYPDIKKYIDYGEQTVEIEIALPGVKKENISVKALPTWFHITAKRDDGVEYSANTGFGTEIEPTKTTADYNNGLLEIHAHIRNPLDKAKEISF